MVFHGSFFLQVFGEPAGSFQRLQRAALLPGLFQRLRRGGGPGLGARGPRRRRRGVHSAPGVGRRGLRLGHQLWPRGG